MELFAIRYKYLQSIPATIPIKVFLSKLDEYTDIAITAEMNCCNFIH
jgi:hypothetical protein